MKKNDLISYLHCKECLKDGTHPDLAVGMTKEGEFVVWCEVHDMPVAALTSELAERLKKTPCGICGVVGPHTHH